MNTELPLIHYPFIGSNGAQYQYDLEPATFLAFCRAAMMILKEAADDGRILEMVYHLVRFGAQLPNDTVPQDLDVHIQDILTSFMETARDAKWEEDRDPVLWICYKLLQEKKITRDQAYGYALQMLGIRAPKSANSWRVRVDEFAKRRDLEPIGQPIRKTRAT